MPVKFFVLIALCFCFATTGFEANANQAKIRKCDNLLAAQRGACSVAKGHCEAIGRCKSVLSFLKNSRCLDARKSREGCTNTLNECIRKEAKARASSSEFKSNPEFLFDTIALKRCATYKWSGRACKIYSDHRANHCPGAIVSLYGGRSFGDPNFTCKNTVESARHVVKLCNARRKEFHANNCTGVQGFEGWKLEPIACE